MIDIVELIKNDNKVESNTPKICMIEGPWGIGKTYYVEHNICPKIKKYFKNIVKISLFGIKNKEEIKNQIIDFYMNNKLELLSKIGKCLFYLFMIFDITYLFFLIFCTKQFVIFNITIPLFDKDYMFIWFPFHLLTKLFYIFSIYIFLNVVSKWFPLNNLLLALYNKCLGSGLSLNKVNVNNLFESKNTLFIFDDLERISDTTDIREILGFINELRENEGFNIIIIANEEELNRNYNKYTYYKEKMCIDKYNMTYNPEIYEQLTKTDNVELKNLYDRLVKPTCTISTKSSTDQTNNLRIIILFIDIVKKVYMKLKKDNVSIIEHNIDSILNADKNNKLCTYGFLANLQFHFNLYIKHIDDLKENIIKFDKNKFTNILENTIKWSNLSIVDDRYIEEKFEETKLSLILDICFIYKNKEDCYRIIKEIINCKDQISSFNECRLILTFFLYCGDKYIKENEKWLIKISDIWFKKGTASDLVHIHGNIDPKINTDMIDNRLITFVKSNDILSWFINELNETNKAFDIYLFSDNFKMFKMILKYNPDVLLNINFNNYRPFIAYVFNHLSKDDINNTQVLQQIRDTLDLN
ncbi:hypothetical protein HDR60_04805 [bacterium]|nr:hypothetical protein [bacterium]